MAASTLLAELLADPRLAGLVAVPTPALLIDESGNLLFANPAALALIGAKTLRGAATRESTLAPFADTARRFVESLPAGAAPRLERIRIAGSLQPSVFACSHIVIADEQQAILFAGMDAGRSKPPSLVDAVRSIVGPDEPFALFDLTGQRMHVNPGAIAAIDANTSAAFDQAREDGVAELLQPELRLLFRRIGTKAQPAILVLAEKVSVPEATAEAPPPSDAANVEPAPAETEALAPKAPTRFVWQADAAGYFASVSADLAAVVGEEAAQIEGLDWREAAARIGIEGIEAVVVAVARRDTWSGVIVRWPISGGDLMQLVELAALPVFDRAREFQGYRGFGVFREKMPRSAEEVAKSALQIKPAVAPTTEPEPENVVQFRAAAPEARVELSPTERTAFREIAREIGVRLEGIDVRTEFGKRALAEAEPLRAVPREASLALGERALLDRLPLGIVVHRGERVLYANRTALEWTGFADVEALEAEGGLGRLFAGVPPLDPPAAEATSVLAIAGKSREPIPVEARLISVSWDGETALAYLLRRAGAGLDERMENAGIKLRETESANRELRSILDTATDGIVLLDGDGRILDLNRSAEALFGYDARELDGAHFTRLFAPESHRGALDYLEGLAANGVASLLNDGREVIGQVREGGLIPLFMTIGRIADDSRKFCAVFRDITQWKRAEEELLESKRKAEQSSSAKSDFLARISHEIRTPLNAIIGFADVMREERFGPIGNERYREYLKDIQTSGAHLVSLINDLLDLSKIEAGKIELSFASVDLNDIARQCMAIMQSQANRERIIIRTSLTSELPQVVADVRSIRQILLNLLSNSIKFTPPGGQVIVSTQLADSGEVLLRVRDTGVGMTGTEIQAALEPFRQLATSGRGTAGSGLGLPLTKALTEANRASFAIKSSTNGGTLVEISFPPTRVLAG